MGVLGKDPFRRGPAAHAPETGPRDARAKEPSTQAPEPEKARKNRQSGPQQGGAGPVPKARGAGAKTPSSAPRSGGAVARKTRAPPPTRTEPPGDGEAPIPAATPRGGAAQESTRPALPAKGEAAPSGTPAPAAVPAGVKGETEPAPFTELPAKEAAGGPRNQLVARAVVPAPLHVPGEESAGGPPAGTHATQETGGSPPDVAPSPEQPAQGKPVQPTAAPAVAAGLMHLLRAGLGLEGAAGESRGRDEQLARQLRPLGDFLYDHYWRVRVDGAGQVPAGPCLLIANHGGVLPVDGPVLHAALRRERPELPGARWLVEDAVYHTAFLGPLLHRLGALRASPGNALRVLRERRPLIVFPEGNLGTSKPWSERYQLQRLGRGGFVKIALEAGVPIVPVAIVGSEETSPLLARVPAQPLGLPWLALAGPVPLPARWSIRLGTPITPPELGPASEPLAARVERGVELTRAAIQGMLDTLVAERPNPFR